MSIYRQNILMVGSGSESFSIPAGPAFMSIINNTDNVMWVHQERLVTNNPDIALVKVPQYTSLTIPITQTRRDFTVFYQDGGGAGTKKVEFIFSTDNLQINGLLGTNVTGSITIGADGVGLIKTSDLDLDGDGRLGVNVNTMPAVNVSTLPSITLAGKSAIAVTSAGAGDVVVKASAGVVYAIKIVGAIDVILKDGSTNRWFGDLNGMHPISCGASITLNFSAAGDAYIIHE